MEPELLTRMTLAEAIQQDPRVLKVAEALPIMSATVGELMVREEFEHFRNLLQTLPHYAVLKGVAAGADGRRVGVYGCSDENCGVYAESPNGTALFATGRNLAAQFVGRVEHQGDMKCIGTIDLIGDMTCTGADFAEDFTVSEVERAEPGTVMVLGEDGVLTPSCRAYDTRIAGVVSGAGDYRPGLVLDRQPDGGPRRPIALVGKVFCKVDAGYGPIRVGTLLTTSDTPGHAMAAGDAARAFGAVLGKAMQPLALGVGLIPILVALQ